MPYVDSNDRLTVRKYHSVKGKLFLYIVRTTLLTLKPGFYGVTYRMGYRETFDTSVSVGSLLFSQGNLAVH